MSNKLKKTISRRLCLGCGLCESVGKEYGYFMELSRDGFYTVQIPSKRYPLLERTIIKICPAINLTEINSKEVWGPIRKAYYGWSNDAVIRNQGSSGGLITALATYLLQNKMVDGILQVGVKADDPLHNELKVSKTAEAVLSNASSRYAPALVFNKIRELLECSADTYCFVGKPCDIIAFRKLISIYPYYKSRIKFFISLVCAGIPSYNGTKDLLVKETNRKDLPMVIRYRGEGWPGYFSATYKDGYCYKASYTLSYGKYLKNYTHFRCKICPDGIGLSSDITVGDAWNTPDGYPNFEEMPGRSFALVRTKSGEGLIQQAFRDGVISLETLLIDRLAVMQPYQYQRRVTAGYRIIIAHLFNEFIFNLKGLNLFALMNKYSAKKGIRESLGTIKRLYKWNHYLS